MQQPVLAAGGHHAVGLVGSLGHQIVDQRPDVPVASSQDKGALPSQLPRRVDARDKALRRRLFISARTVELPRPVQAGDFFALQRGIQLRRINTVILDGIGAARHFRVFESRDRVQHLYLHLLRHGGGKALDV